jgi:hypothetical protein
MNSPSAAHPSLQDILRIAGDAYSAESDGFCAFPATLADAHQHTSGDTLADFVVIELHEALGGEAPDQLLPRAIGVLSTARRQLDAVISALAQYADQGSA